MHHSKTPTISNSSLKVSSHFSILIYSRTHVITLPSPPPFLPQILKTTFWLYDCWYLYLPRLRQISVRAKITISGSHLLIFSLLLTWRAWCHLIDISNYIPYANIRLLILVLLISRRIYRYNSFDAICWCRQEAAPHLLPMLLRFWLRMPFILAPASASDYFAERH
jgi:hypothetical protein